MTRTRKPTSKNETEQHSDAWQRFERAVDAAIKGGPKHRPSKPPEAKKPRKKASR